MMLVSRHLLASLILMPTLASAEQARLPEPLPSAAAQMFEQLEAGDWRNWIEKAEALDYLSRYEVPNAGPAVQRILDDTHPNNRWLRGQAVIAMARIDPDHAAVLAKTHVGDPHTEVRVAVARVCVDLTSDQASPILKVLFEDKTPAVQFATLAAHARHHREQAWDRAEALTADIPEDALESAIRALAWIGNGQALERLRERIASGKHPRVIFDGLAGVTNPSLVPTYLNLLASSDDLTLLSGVWAQLKTFERNAVVSACQAALASGDPKMVQAVSRLVASYLREPALGEPLQTALNLCEDRATRLLGLSALSCIEADLHADFFVSHLEHEDPQVRAMAVHCLAQCQEVNLYEVLEESLSDEDAGVRVAVLTALRHGSGDSVPEERILDYFTSSLLSPDQATRVAAVEALVPYVHLDNAQAALELMLKMQDSHGAAGTEPLMDIVFRLVEPEQAAQVLQGNGYVAKWHVLGAFPSGPSAPKEDVDGFAFAYPPEKEIDLTKRYEVPYNIEGDARRKKDVEVAEIGWSSATVDDADGILHMLRPGNAQLLMPSKRGVCYAYAELTLAEDTEAKMTCALSSQAQDRIWLNGKVIGMEAKVDQKARTATKTAAVNLRAGRNRVLVKMVSDDSSMWWAVKISARAFSMRLTDKDGKPVKWSHE